VDSLHRVKVFGREVQVRGPATHEQVREVESLINTMIAELEASMKTVDPQIVAIMALLNLAEANLLQTRENARISHLVCERISRLINNIDATINKK
jgi:cell division protein ZapA (FtsZ GTPase activity inhibitor)